jgi:hypothetical protein
MEPFLLAAMEHSAAKRGLGAVTVCSKLPFFKERHS